MFSLGNGTGRYFWDVTDNANGTYTVTFTGTTAGTNTIGGDFIDGQALTSTPANITVTPARSAWLGRQSPCFPFDCRRGLGTRHVDCQGRERQSVDEAGGSTILALGGGTAQGTFGTVTDNADGTYSSMFTATAIGSNTITATLGGQPVTSTAPTITVT